MHAPARPRPPSPSTSARAAARPWFSRPAGSRPGIAVTGASGAAAPKCEWRSEEVHAETAIDAFDEELDLGTRALCEVLKTLEHENMQFVVDTFAVALEADLITADDFR